MEGALQNHICPSLYIVGLQFKNSYDWYDAKIVEGDQSQVPLAISAMLVFQYLGYCKSYNSNDCTINHVVAVAYLILHRLVSGVTSFPARVLLTTTLCNLQKVWNKWLYRKSKQPKEGQSTQRDDKKTMVTSTKETRDPKHRTKAKTLVVPVAFRRTAAHVASAFPSCFSAARLVAMKDRWLEPIQWRIHALCNAHPETSWSSHRDPLLFILQILDPLA